MINIAAENDCRKL